VHLREITSTVMHDAGNLRNAEQRELFLSGLRLATGENRSIDEVHRPGDRMLGSPEPPAAADKSAVGRSLPVPDEPSLAVLPFLYLSGDSEQEYFADGITDDHGNVALSLPVSSPPALPTRRA
jgi:hypothetical protein